MSIILRKLNFIEDVLITFQLLLTGNKAHQIFKKFQIISIVTLSLQQKNKVTIPSLSLLYSFQLWIIKISHKSQIDLYKTSLKFQEFYIVFIQDYFKCLIDRSFLQQLNSFHNDVENIKSNLIKNAYPPFLIVTIFKSH